MLLELLRSALGEAPQGFSIFEYIFSFVLLLIGLFLVFQIFNSFFSLFRSGKR